LKKPVRRTDQILVVWKIMGVRLRTAKELREDLLALPLRQRVVLMDQFLD
jgi:hypothetical protein